MDKNKGFVKNTLILFIGKFSTQIVSFLLLPLFTFKFSATDYGYIDLIQTYVSLFAPVLLLQLDSAIFRFLIDARKEEKEKIKLISTSSIFVVSILFFIILIGIILNTIIIIKFFKLIILNICVLILNLYIMSIARGNGNNKSYSISSCISSFVNLLLNLLLILVFCYDVRAILISSIISNIVSILYLVIKENILSEIKLKYYDKSLCKKLLKYSIPMIPNVLSWWLVGLSDRTIIVKMLSMEANGIYSVSCKFSNLLNSVFSIFNMSWQETASIHINDKDVECFFSYIINNILILFIILSCCIIGILPIIYTSIIGKEYIEAYNYVPILIIGNLFNVLVGLFGGVYVAKKMTNKVAITTIYSAIINILFNVLLIKKIGLLAACLSTVMAYFIMSIYRYFDIKKYIEIKLRFKEIFKYVCCFLSLLIPYYTSKGIISLLLTIVICIKYIIKYRMIIILIFNNKKIRIRQ